MKYKLAIFDLDGTILDTLEDLKNSVNYALEINGFPIRTREEVRTFIGNGIRKLIERAVPNGTEMKKIDKVFCDFKEYYGEHSMDTTKPYDGIVEIINKIRSEGMKTAVVSNKADFAVQKLCDEFFYGLFDFVVGEREGIRRKPAPDSVNEVLKKIEIDKKDAVYIGDSDVDVETANNADIDCIAVLWGFRTKEEILNSDKGQCTFVMTINELKNILQ